MGTQSKEQFNLTIPDNLIPVFDKLGNVNLLYNQFEQNPQAILITNTNGETIYVNKKMVELTGYTRDELVGENPSKLKSGAQPDSFYDRLWDNIRKGETFESRFKNKKKSGELYWAYSVISALYNDNKEIVGFIAIQEDITNLVKFEEENIENEFVLQNLTRSLPNIGIIVLSHDPDEVFQAEGEIIQEFFSDKKPTYEDLVNAFKVYGYNLGTEVKKFCSKGSGRRKKVQVDERTIDFHISPVQISNSEKSYCLLVIRDVTYYQKIIEQVQNSEKQLEAIFQNAGVGIAILDPAGKHLRTNNGWSDLIGYTKSEILNATVHDFVHPEDMDVLRPELHQVLKGVKSSVRVETRAIRKDKRVIWGDVSITAIRGQNNEVTAVIAVFVDITDNKLNRDALEKSEKQFRELNATKDKFFSIISHDLKNPFSNILGLTDLVLEDPDDKTHDQLLSYIQAINSSANQAYSLLQNLLDWSRSQTGAMSPALVHHDLYDIVSTSIDHVINMADSKNISIENNMNTDQWVICDYDMMNTVVRNLLTNAIKFSHKDSKIEISSQKEKSYTTLIIQDYGVGMADDFKNKHFDITHNISSPGTNNEKGTGLGLILVNDFVKLNNGELSFESQLDEGTTFKVKIPNEVV